MKNIFKSLMFVAVAAMTFTACEKDNAENNNNNGAEQKTTITFNAKMADTDTRTYFGAYDEVNGYPTLLNGNEVAKFSSCSSSNGLRLGTEATINNGRFTVDLAVASNDNIYAYLPASAWGEQYLGGSEGNYVALRDYNFPMEQNPSTTSVDPAAHIFKATTTYNDEDNIDLYFEHQVAYGKMSLRNFAGADVEQYVLTINGETYVVNAAWTTDVWFACEPAEVSEMSVSVVTANGTYTKPLAVSAGNTLNFVKGQVSAFGVNMDGVTTGEAVDTFNPNVLLAEPTIDSNNGTCFKFNYADGSDKYFRFWLADVNRANDMMAVGSYMGNGVGNSDNYTPDATHFAATLYDKWGRVSGSYARHFTSASTLDVSFADGAYTIILTHNGQTYGYKGMPEGWTAPAGGGNEGGEEPAEPVQLNRPTVSASANGNTVTATWASITGAANYTVSVNGTVKEAALNATSYEFVGEYETAYTISVVANPANATTHTASEAGTASVTTGADPNAGGGDDPIVYDPWACQKIGNYSGYPGNYTVTVQGTGSNTDTIVLSGLAVGNALLDITVTKEGVPGEGKGYIDGDNYHVVFDVTIGNVTYRGTTSNSII